MPHTSRMDTTTTNRTNRHEEATMTSDTIISSAAIANINHAAGEALTKLTNAIDAAVVPSRGCAACGAVAKRCTGSVCCNTTIAHAPNCKAVAAYKAINELRELVG